MVCGGVQEEGKLRAVQAQCLAGQMPSSDHERGLSPGVLAVHRLASILGDRFGHVIIINRRAQLTHAINRLSLAPASWSITKDGAMRTVYVRSLLPMVP